MEPRERPPAPPPNNEWAYLTGTFGERPRASRIGRAEQLGLVILKPASKFGNLTFCQKNERIKTGR